jgi:LmbE family N-acetylglucosaminyl deacetylase
MAGGDVLLVAPHSDDVALSMGATARLLCGTTSPRLVTVFTRVAARAADPRRAEDGEYAAAIGAAHTWCGIRESGLRPAIRRGGPPARLVMLGLTRAVTRRLRPILAPGAVVFGPLAVGGHVDHVLVRQALLGLRRRHRVFLYEDLPYAASLALPDVRAVARRLDDAIRPVDVDAGEMLEAKRRDCLLYRSQGPERLWPALLAHAGRLQEGRLVERFWTW